MILVIYFDAFHKDLERRLREYNIPYKLVKYDDLINENHRGYKTIIICGSRKRILRHHDLPLLDPYLCLCTGKSPTSSAFISDKGNCYHAHEKCEGLKQDIHIIGICFGFQFLALKSGGKIEEHELFRGTMHDTRPNPKPSDTRPNPKPNDLYYNHHDRVTHLPSKWKIIQKVDGFINIASTNKWIGFQFHPEKYDATFRHYLLPFLHLRTF